MTPEDWRVEVDLAEDHHREGFLEHLASGADSDEASALSVDAERAFAHHVVVTRDGPVVFLYPHDAAEAHRAADVVRDVLREHGWRGDVTVTRWHPDEEEWEDISAPIPDTAAEHGAEHQKMIDRERDATAAAHSYQFEVLVTVPHHRQADALAGALAAEGMTVARRWRYIVVGAADEDEGERIAARIRAAAPEGTTATVWTARSLHETVDYLSEVAAGNPFVIVSPPRG